jgi:hypothetical protein
VKEKAKAKVKEKENLRMLVEVVLVSDLKELDLNEEYVCLEYC